MTRQKTDSPQAASALAVSQIQARLEAALPDERFAIAAICEGALRWAESGGSIASIRRVIVHPGPDWEQHLSPEDRQTFEELRSRAIERCAAKTEHDGTRAESR